MGNSLVHIAIEPFVSGLELLTGNTPTSTDFDVIYNLYSKTFGQEQAEKLLTKVFEDFRNTHTDQDVGDLLGIFPKNLFVNERLAYLSHQELEKIVKEKIAEAIKMKDEFFYIAIHDLKTPVAAIKGFVSLLEDSQENLSPDLLEDIKSIKEGSQRLQQLVNDLLEVARSESGTIKLDLLPVDIKSIVDQTIKQVSVPATDKRVVINTNVPSIKVLADEKKLSEVVENLLSNAVKYNKIGGTVNISAIPLDNILSIKVQDTGLGIPVDQQTKIFQKFFRAQNETTRDIQGTGLGLFVVKMLVEKMGGTITFNSTEGAGTNFTFTLKLAN